MLILFDIDGTLVSSGEAGTRSLNRAFEELFGIPHAFRDIKMAGKTDPQIMREAMQLHGIAPTEENLKNMIEAYIRYLRVEIENPWRKLFPGVKEALEHLKNRNHHMGLLTGNLQEGARIKLSPFGLNPYFPTGAFGSDHEDRNQLLPIAIERFSSNGVRFTPEQTIVIGDTPRDIQCAHVHGAYAVAVATGPYSADELSANGADLVLGTLEEIDRLERFLQEI